MKAGSGVSAKSINESESGNKRNGYAA